MTTAPLLDLASASRIVREALKDKSYRSTPLGLEVARYIRWKRTEWGAKPGTIRDYESILARLAVFYADLELSDFEIPAGPDRLRECWDHFWGESAARTRSKVRSVWADFFDWAIAERRDEDGHPLIRGNPARVLRAPKRRGVKREPFGQAMVAKVIGAQEYLPDKLGVFLVIRYGIRRAELAEVAFKDFDFERRQLTVTGKGDRIRVVPIIENAFWRYLAAAQLEHGLGQEDFLLYRTRKVGMRLLRYHSKAIAPRSVHTWWYRCLASAGVVAGDKDEGGWRGFQMHRGRHTLATEVLRGSGNIVAAQHALGHADESTTADSYAMFDTDDLARVLRDIRDENEEF